MVAILLILFILTSAVATDLKYDVREIKHIKITPLPSNAPVLESESFVSLLQALNNKCLVHFVNFQGVDLPLQGTGKPVVLTQFKALHVKYFVSRPWIRLNFTETRHRVMYTNELERITERKLKLCLLNGNDLDSRECIQDIPHLDQTPKARPWLCERHFYLLPPAYQKGSTFYRWVPHTDSYELILPDAFRKFWVQNLEIQWDQTVTKQTPRKYHIINREIFDILVTNHDGQDSVRSWSLGLTRIRDSFGLTTYHTTSNRELLVVKTSLDKVGRETILGANLLCRYCNRCKPLFVIPIEGKLEYSRIRTFINVANEPIHNIVGRVSGFGKWVHTYKSSGWQYPEAPKCHRMFHSTMRKRLKDITSFQYYYNMETMQKLLSNMTVYGFGENCKRVAFFSNAFKETTHFVDKSRGMPGCGCADHLVFTPVFTVAPTGANEHSDMYFHSSSLKFVSCGESNESSLNFRSLVWIFKPNVWIIIIITWITIALASYLLQTVKIETYIEPMEVVIFREVKKKWMHILHFNIIPNVLTYLKGFLEQGNPLRPVLWRDDRSAFVHCLFLLMVMSLSNLYKNDNISELTLPRKPVPYDTFEMLEKHGFDLFARPVEIIWGAKFEFNIPQIFQNVISEFSKRFLPRSNSHYYFMTISELYYYALSETKFMDFAGTNTDGNISQIAKKYINRTKIVSNWANLVISTDNKTNLDILNVCNKTALWLPENEALQLYLRMKRGDKKRKVFLSSAPFFTFKHGLRVLHWIPEQLVTKGKLFSENGADIWLERLYSFAILLSSGYRGEEAGKTTLGGNIVVVLLIVPTGLLVSCVCFIWEVRHKVSAALFKLLHVMLRAYRHFKRWCATFNWKKHTTRPDMYKKVSH